MSSNDKTLISDLMESFVIDVPADPFVSFCVFCNKGVTQQNMTYQKGKVFHKDCYDKHGSSYPELNHEQITQNNDDKVQLVQLRNLKIRMSGTSNSNSKSKTKKKSKSKTKKRPSKKRVAKKKRTITKRKKMKKKTTRKTKKRPTKRKITRRR